ncbi:MAG TPA: hypothetical protein VNQ76_02120 [Planctomicrobium sp.]|nr:hypothetical protein [Planctomicrobium sp.]
MVLVTITLIGCGRDSGPQFGTVTGTVTLDGEPLPYAKIEFQPEGKRSSAGITDAKGKYELGYSFSRSGAITGPHSVWIVMAPANEIDRPEGAVIEIPKVKLPKKYNEQTELAADVKKGKNTINFDLTLK